MAFAVIEDVTPKIELDTEKKLDHLHHRSALEKEIKRTSRWYFGGIAATTACCCTHPLDMMKVSHVLEYKK